MSVVFADSDKTRAPVSSSQPLAAVMLPPSEAVLLARARALVPVLRERTKRCEEGRQIPAETIADFREAGFFDILKMPRYGGYGMTITTLARVIQEVGRGCMPSAWVLFVLGTHPLEIALLDPQAAVDVFGSDPNALIGSSYAPLGKMEKVEGGYRLNGTWRFCSGLDHASWVSVGGMVRLPGQDRPDFRSCLVPKKDYVVDANSWRTIGLAGTGSKDLAISDVFVPEHRSHSLADVHLMRGQEKLDPAYRYPYWPATQMAMVSAIIGGALGAVDEFKRQFATRQSSFDSGPGRPQAADDPFVRNRLGQATMWVRGAMARVEVICNEMTRRIAANEAMPVEDRLGWAAEAAQCGKMSEDAVLLLFKATGARGLALDNPMQGILRNVLGGTSHIGMNFEMLNSSLGGVMLGRENTVFAC